MKAHTDHRLFEAAILVGGALFWGIFVLAFRTLA